MKIYLLCLVNSRFGFDFITLNIIDYRGDNEDSDDADCLVHSPACKRKRIHRRVAEIAFSNRADNCEDDEEKEDLESCTSVSDQDSAWAWLDSFDDTTDDSFSEFEL